MGYFQLAAKDLLYAPSHKQDSTYHGHSALSGTRNSTIGPPRGMESDNPSHLELMLCHRAHLISTTKSHKTAESINCAEFYLTN